MKKAISYLFFISLLLVNTYSSMAQCAMCKAVPTSNLEGGGNIAKGLNTGILYLMAIPYILIFIGVIYFVRKEFLKKQ